MGVFDGMGGPGNGDTASRAAAQSLEKELLSRPDNSPGNIEAVRKWIEAATIRINKAVKEAIGKNLRAGTTGTIATIIEDTAFIVNAGDSRCYLFNKESLDFKLLTKDDGLTNDPEVQIIVDSASEIEDLTTIEALHAFKDRNFLTLCFGHIEDYNPATITKVELNRGDILLLSSDGLHDNLTYQEIVQVLISSKDEDFEKICKDLVAATELRIQEDSFRSKDDDVSVVLMSRV